MLGRLVRPDDFERVLRSPPRARSHHFAIHHLVGRPSMPAGPSRGPVQDELSTGLVPKAVVLVDECAAAVPLEGRWLGMVVPKKHARRSVTRSLLKRQIRAAIAAGGERLQTGLWVVRLRAPFDRAQFPSAASCALRLAAHEELDLLVRQAAR